METLIGIAEAGNGCVTSRQAVEAGLICHSCADELLGLGLVEIKTSYGSIVRAYDTERTLCDLLRGQGVVDDQVVTPAMQAYMKRPDKNLVKLMDYADMLGVEKKIKMYVKVLCS